MALGMGEHRRLERSEDFRIRRVVIVPARKTVNSMILGVKTKRLYDEAEGEG